MSLPLVTLRLKRPAVAPPAAAAAARQCKPRTAAPPSEDLEAADALRGLFAASPPAAPAPAASSAQSKRVLKMVRTRPAARIHRPVRRLPPPARLRPRRAPSCPPPPPSRTQAKQQPKNYKLSDGQLDGILQLAKASPKPLAAAPPAAAPPASKIQFEQLRTTLWDRVAKKRIPATSYQGNMQMHLAANPHLEIYNRQDRQRPAGQTLMAGMHVPTFAPSPSSCHENPKVVLWHVLERRKLSRDESPTQGELCRFLQVNPCIAVYEGQQAPVPSPQSAPEAPLKPPPTKPAAITAAVALPQPAVAAGELLQLAKGLKAPRAKPAKQVTVRWKSVVALQAC